jgi:hypothetical protein
MILEFNRYLRTVHFGSTNYNTYWKSPKNCQYISDHLLYARVDGIIINSELHLMEIECIEPDLYFNLSENALERFVNAIVELIQ